jgi:hypothetical protein
MASAFHDLRPEQVSNAVTQSFPNAAGQSTVCESHPLMTKANPNSWCPQGNFLILIMDEIQVISW